MQPIGGYFSLELSRHEEYHKDAIRLNTGRNCLEYILRVRRYKKIYIPYYTCEVLLEPLMKLNVAYEFYHINLNFELVEDIHLHQNEALLYTNYYGLKQQYVKTLARCYGKQFIVDNTQAFYAKPVTDIDTFYTCRKFFGVPDGAYLYTNNLLDEDLEQDQSFDRVTSLIKRIDLGPKAGYADFRETSKSFVGQPIKRMSIFTQRMMQAIDYDTVAKRRRVNYKCLHDALGTCNTLSLPLEGNMVPLVYPFNVEHGTYLRQNLIDHQVFCARYWPNVLEWCNFSDVEFQLTNNLVCLPIDQRYGEEEMNRISQFIKQYLS